jgi:hypothetical protein
MFFSFLPRCRERERFQGALAKTKKQMNGVSDGLSLFRFSHGPNSRYDVCCHSIDGAGFEEKQQAEIDVETTRVIQ